MSKAEWREGLSSEERDRAIESILDEALPSCEASYGRMRGNFAALSLRALFFGIEDCAILAGIITLAGAAPLAFIAEPGDAVLAVFMLAPLFFAALQGLVAWKDRESGTIAWRAACRMTVFEFHAARMLAFGAMAILLTVPLAAAAWVASERMVSFWWMLSLAAASLATFGAFSLLIFRLNVAGRMYGAAQVVVVPLMPIAIWALAGMLLAMLPAAATALLAVPAVVFSAVAAAATILFVRLIADACTMLYAEYA